MDRKTVKKLAHKSFNGDSLDDVRVKKLYPLLKRRELKAYLRELKELIDRNTVYITLSSDDELSSEARRIFSKTFPGKNIKVNLDPSLLGGVRIRDYDMIYELSLRDQLEEALKSVTEYEN